MSGERIPFVDLSLMHKAMREQILEQWAAVYDRGWFIQGAELAAFEKEFAEFSQTKFCAGVGNGLDAITIGLEAMGIGKGDRVLVPAHTFTATALAAVRTGAELVLADVDPDTANVTAETLTSVESKGVRAAIPVHLYGQICLMDKIMDLAKSRDWLVLEDNAQSQGAELKGRLTGTWGDLAATSFYPGKNIGALGDAGAVVTNNPDLDRKVRMLRNYGSERKYHHDAKGYNSRLDEVQAAVLRIKLRSLIDGNKLRVEAANRYREGLSNVSEIKLPVCAEGAGHVYHLFAIRSRERDKLQAHLLSSGVETVIHYPFPIHKQKAFSELALDKGHFPNADMWADQELSLPLYPGITIAQQLRVINAVRSFYGHKAIEGI